MDPSFQNRLDPFQRIILILHIGCDETGSGDFFGPLCVVACYIDERDYDWLASLNVRDPKLMTPQEVIEIARRSKIDLFIVC